MTMLWFEGWEAMDTTTLPDYYVSSNTSFNAIDASPPSGRSSQALRITSSSYIQISFDDTQSLVMGAAVRKTAAGNDAFPFVLYDGTGAQCSIYWSSSSNFVMRRSTSIALETSAGIYGANTWYYLEWKVTVGNAGTWELKVDGVVALSGSGDTQARTTDLTTELRMIGDIGGTFYWDDNYLLSQAGSAPYNDYLGDVTVESIVPNGNGTTTNWTPLSGSNYQNVDEIPHDDDTTYVSASTVADTDLYTMSDLPSSDITIYGVQNKVVARKEASGTRTMKPVIRTGGTNFEGDEFGLSTDYAAGRHVWEQNPDTLADWTFTEVNGIEAGQKVQS